MINAHQIRQRKYDQIPGQLQREKRTRIYEKSIRSSFGFYEPCLQEHQVFKVRYNEECCDYSNSIYLF